MVKCDVFMFVLKVVDMETFELIMRYNGKKCVHVY